MTKAEMAETKAEACDQPEIFVKADELELLRVKAEFADAVIEFGRATQVAQAAQQKVAMIEQRLNELK
ncbi:MAG: hypothetical protein R2682_01975 [Pyrinomonadaceae bacterium]